MKKTLLTDGWTFERRSVPPYVKDKGPKSEVTVPHDYAIKSPRSRYAFAGASDGFFQGGVGRYSRFMDFPEAQHAIIQVDGAYAAFCMAESCFASSAETLPMRTTMRRTAVMSSAGEPWQLSVRISPGRLR